MIIFINFSKKDENINLLNKNIAQFRILLDAKTNSKQIDPSDAFSNLKWIFDYFKLV